MRPNRQRFANSFAGSSVRRCDRAGSADQKRLQSQIQLYQARTAMSPTIEEQYKVLTRDYDKRAEPVPRLPDQEEFVGAGGKYGKPAAGGTDARPRSGGTASDPTFPNRLFFAGGGLGAGLALGVGIALWLEIRDRFNPHRERCGGGHGAFLCWSPYRGYPKGGSGLHQWQWPRAAAVWGRGNGHAPDRDRSGLRQTYV